MLILNQLEKDVLKILRDFSDKRKKVDYYGVVNALNLDGDTSRVIPVVSRLEDEGLITSNGWIYRYLYITDKGRQEVANA